MLRGLFLKVKSNKCCFGRSASLRYIMIWCQQEACVIKDDVLASLNTIHKKMTTVDGPSSNTLLGELAEVSADDVEELDNEID